MSRSSSKIRALPSVPGPEFENTGAEELDTSLDSPRRKKLQSSVGTQVERTKQEDLVEPAKGTRASAVWRQWLASMATDAEAVHAAAMAYREMDLSGRENWLRSLEVDAKAVDVPAVALYAPLIAVEDNPQQRERLLQSLEKRGSYSSPSVGDVDTGDNLGQLAPRLPQALIGFVEGGHGQKATRIYVITSPLYLDFVQVLACGVSNKCFSWVRHDPIVSLSGAPSVGDKLEGAILEAAPMKTTLDELALVVLSHERAGEELPEALHVLGELLGKLVS